MTDHSASVPATQPASDSGDKRPRAEKKKGGMLRFLRDVAIILVAAVVISFLIKTFLIRSFYIPSESMEDTLLVNDRIIVNELVPEAIPIEHSEPAPWVG